VAGHRQAIGTEIRDVHARPSHRLYSINMQQRAMASAGTAYVGYGGDHAGLVVCQHDAHQRRTSDSQHGVERRHVDPAAPIDADDRSVGCRGEDGGVLRRAAQNWPADAQAGYRQRVGLGAATGKHQALSLAA
jgi:hypothetical protein